ncbi:hypothetical protein [Mycolicibacterium poriferae]|uniref:hypothetical protein n=1 Tax=Mycolicibacterium poriferae TaxID=39694 RepID=UPI0013D5CF28|nr:hypothetical protein [Mycolicibacterium poriferae]MCV7263936.1 hypothetical protein [Mycolicibacterium poriferae]
MFSAAVFFAAGPATAQAPAPEPSAGSCVLIDTDFDIDDMMTIPTVIGARHVAAVVATEGYTVPALGAPAVEHLIDHPGQRAIPVIVGAATERSEADIAATFGDYVLDYRALMSRVNNALPAALPPAAPRRRGTTGERGGRRVHTGGCADPGPVLVVRRLQPRDPAQDRAGRHHGPAAGR